MKKIFAITCHKLTNPLIYTINYLSSFDDNIVLIHLDLKSHIEDFRFLQSNNVLFIPERVDFVWGGVSQIIADLNLLKFSRLFSYDYFFLLSGDDIPVMTNFAMDLFLQDNYGLQFVHFQNYKNNIVDPYERIKYRHFYFHYRREKSLTYKVLKKSYSYVKFFFKNKYFFSNYEKFPDLYKGVNWFGVTKNMVDYILEYLVENEWYLPAFESSLCADEVFFHSIMNTNKEAIYYFNNDSINNALRYIDWNSGPEYPKILSQDDISNISQDQPVFFARKIHQDISLSYLNGLLKDRC